MRGPDGCSANAGASSRAKLGDGRLRFLPHRNSIRIRCSPHLPGRKCVSAPPSAPSGGDSSRIRFLSGVAAWFNPRCAILLTYRDRPGSEKLSLVKPPDASRSPRQTLPAALLWGGSRPGAANRNRSRGSDQESLPPVRFAFQRTLSGEHDAVNERQMLRGIPGKRFL